MPYQDFREFLGVLRKEGELVDVDRRVALGDVGKALKKAYEKQAPALMFNDTGTSMPLVGGVYSTRKKALLAFEVEEDTLLETITARLNNRILPVYAQADAPCQEVVLTGDQIDLGKLPIPTYSPKDGGPYITAGITVSVDPETGVPDIGHYRFMYLDKDRMSFLAEPNHRFGKNLAKHRAMGRKPQGALVIGVDPVIAYTCQFKVSDTTDDWEVAGALRNQPVELVRCKTIDLAVPATAELVIEFEVDLDETHREGPLGEHTGYYDATGRGQPAAVVTAITHRRNPIFQALLTGKPVTENHILKQVPLEVSFTNFMKSRFPNVEKISLRLSTSLSNYIVIAMKPTFAGQVRQVMMTAISSELRPKWVIIVDPDIDVHNPSDVEWAMAFRVRPRQDVVVFDDTPRAGCDPSVSDPYATSSAVGVDATIPLGEPFPDVADVPGWQEFDLPEIER